MNFMILGNMEGNIYYSHSYLQNIWYIYNLTRENFLEIEYDKFPEKSGEILFPLEIKCDYCNIVKLKNNIFIIYFDNQIY